MISFVVVLLSSCVLEIVSGVYNDDIHLVSDGFRSGFHGMCVYFGLIGFTYAINHDQADKKCTYGYERTQVVVAFGNAIFALFIGIFELLETLHILANGPRTHTETSSLFVLSFKVIFELFIFTNLKKYLDNNDNRPPIYDNLGVITIQCLSVLVSETLYIFTTYLDLDDWGFPFYYLEPFVNII